MLVHLGIDSTDSLTKGMCTTYVGMILAKRLLSQGAHFVDYPNLIRLNPTIPYKTRGNGAVALRIEIPENRIGEVFATARETVEEFAVFSDPQTNPGIALYAGDVPDTLHTFYEQALHRLLEIEDAYSTAEEVGARLHGYKDKRGVIGALASVGGTLENDHTYELLAYREEKAWGMERLIDEKTVIAVDKKMEDIFFNYDYEENSLCIAPHTVCPVLAGIRGEIAECVKEAISLIDLGEPVSSYAIFRTNQHTNFHFEKVSSVSEISDYSSVIVDGEVVDYPFIIQGGHVFFELENEGLITCAAFEPTKSFRNIVRNLIPGDKIRVYGGVKPANSKKKRALNLERLDILDLKTNTLSNPHCPQCGKSMTSEGKGKGFQCKKCRIRKREKESAPINRILHVGSFEPPPSAWRHLYKMISRNKENNGKKIELIEGWIG